MSRRLYLAVITVLLLSTIVVAIVTYNMSLDIVRIY